MKLKRRFYNSSISFYNISIERLVFGILIGLAYAFTIYGFAYLMRESIRLMSSGFGYLPNILSDEERNIYNWFFAALALIFGNSITIAIIFGGTNQYLGKKQFKNRRIINDQIVLNSSFAYWFLKICYIVGIFSMSFSDFNFLPDYFYAVIIIVIVLYLEAWKTLSLVLKRHRFKWMLGHFLFFLCCSFGLSKFDFVDYKHIDNNQLRYKPKIDLPRCDYHNITFQDYYYNVYVKEGKKVKLAFGYYESFLNNSYSNFLDLKLKSYKPFKDKIAIRISANKNTKFSTIKLIEEQIKKAKINYVIFGTFEDDTYATRFSNKGIKMKLRVSGYDEDDIMKNVFFWKPHYFEVNEDIIPKDTLKINIAKTLRFNDSLISKKLLHENFQKNINKNIIFQYKIDSSTTYQNYLTVLSAHLSAIDLLRKDNCKVQLKWDKEKMKYTNKEEFIKEQERLRQDFPFHMLEIEE